MEVNAAKRPAKNLSLALFFIVLYCAFYALLGAAVKTAAVTLYIETIALWRCLVGGVLLFIWISLLSPQKKHSPR